MALNTADSNGIHSSDNEKPCTRQNKESVIVAQSVVQWNRAARLTGNVMSLTGRRLGNTFAKPEQSNGDSIVSIVGTTGRRCGHRVIILSMYVHYLYVYIIANVNGCFCIAE